MVNWLTINTWLGRSKVRNVAIGPVIAQ